MVLLVTCACVLKDGRKEIAQNVTKITSFHLIDDLLLVATEKSKPQFLSSMYNRTFYQEFGSTVLLSCPVTGYPQPNIIWFKDDVLLVGAITEDYEIKKLDLNTRGIYQCNASNELGSIASGDIPVKIRGR